MKTGLTKILTLSSIALLALASCKKNDALITTNGGTAGALTASSTTLPLDKAKVNDTSTVITFTSTPPKYGFTAATTNTLEIDPAGDNWKSPTSVALGTKVYSQGYSTSAFNTLLLKLNLPAGTASTVNVRIQYALSATEFTYSNVVSMSVTPFNLTSWLYVVGAFQGWNTSSADSLESATGNNIYTGVIYFPPNSGNVGNVGGNNQFLILPTRSFNTKYCTAGGADTTGIATGTAPYSYASEFVTSGGSNFVVKTVGGYYIVTLNLVTNTLTLTPADYYSLIGNTTPGSAWSTDTPLKYINDGNNNWSISGVAMTVGLAPNNGFKIRQDDAWSFSWGTSSTAGTLTDNSGVNISIATAGNYNVTFNMAPTAYGTTPVVTAAYTLVQQ